MNYKTKRILFFSTGTLTLSTLYLLTSGHFKFLVPFLFITVLTLVIFLLNEIKKS